MSIGPVVAEDEAPISIATPFISDRGDLRALISNNSKKEIQIYPSSCGVEVRNGDATTSIPAKDPQFVSLVSLRIAPGEAKVFGFDLIPGLTDLDGELRLFVHAMTTDPLESKTAWSERFKMADIDTKSGANKPRHSTPDRSESK